MSAIHNVLPRQQKEETEQSGTNPDLDSSIPFWRRGRVVIRPHIEFPFLWTYDQILATITDIQLNCDGLLIKIYETNSYCSEVNGRWNVVFSVVSNNTNYTYMIRRDHTLKKTFACPFFNDKYGEIGDICFNMENSPTEFIILERYLLNKYGGKLIDRFQTEL